MSGVVGPARCLYCDRAIYASGDGFVHANGRSYCYAPNGDKRDARPSKPIEIGAPS